MHIAFWICLLLYLCVTSIIHASSTGDPCFDPQERRGVCKPLSECKHILYMLSEQKIIKKKDPVTYKFIREAKRICNMPNGPTIVCCKEPITHCGEPNAFRLSNSVDAELLEYPWMVRLLRMDDVQNEESGICGGSLIDLYNVITAAHCFNHMRNNSFYVLLGEHDTKSDVECIVDGKKKCIRAQKILVESIKKHESYMPQTGENDIAILHLKKEVDITDGIIQPVCLPKLQYQPPKSMIVAGWGLTEHGSVANILQKAEANVINPDECIQKNGARSVRVGTFCAHSKTNSSTCLGDSGGPLVGEYFIPRTGLRFFLFGVISSGSRNCTGQFASVYLNVTLYLDWIEKNKKK